MFLNSGKSSWAIGWRAATAAVIALALLPGCTETMFAENVLGMDKYNVNQCLLRDQPTHQGVILPAGTRGTFQEAGGRAEFIVEAEDGSWRIWYDITDLGWAMRTCREGD